MRVVHETATPYTPSTNARIEPVQQQADEFALVLRACAVTVSSYCNINIAIVAGSSQQRSAANQGSQRTSSTKKLAATGSYR